MRHVRGVRAPAGRCADAVHPLAHEGDLAIIGNPSSTVCDREQSTADLTTRVSARRGGTVSAQMHDRREEAIGGYVLEPLGMLVDGPRASVHDVRTRTSPRYRAASSAR